MEYYMYDGIAYIMNDNKPAGKYLTLGEVSWDIAAGDVYEARVHKVRFTYGDRYISANPSENL